MGRLLGWSIGLILMVPAIAVASTIEYSSPRMFNALMWAGVLAPFLLLFVGGRIGRRLRDRGYKARGILAESAVQDFPEVKRRFELGWKVDDVRHVKLATVSQIHRAGGG
jgi:hypothetical protein